ncbi:MAG: ABC transporter substrate-binding protein, partial [Anaerolineae bacterium]
MEEKRKLTRREFLQVSVLATAGVALTACKQPTPVPTAAPTEAPVATEEPTEEPTEEVTEEATEAPTEEATEAAPEAPASKYGEAPMLAELVAAGSLPPV